MNLPKEVVNFLYLKLEVSIDKFLLLGYKVGQCFLPESIHSPDLDNAKPLKQLVWDISNLVDSFVNRQQQIKELEVHVNYIT